MKHEANFSDANVVELPTSGWPKPPKLPPIDPAPRRDPHYEMRRDCTASRAEYIIGAVAVTVGTATVMGLSALVAAIN